MHSAAAPDYQVIDTEKQLQQAVRLLESQKTIAVDLEADSMYHYKEKVCLLQLAAGPSAMIIDPFAVPDLSILKPVFAAPGIRKVFHGADYDIRSLYRDFDIKINHLFDTELASRFCGAAASGLNAVLFERFGVDLDKKYQKMDWSRRPLPEEMLSYAVGDVRYLIPLAEALERELRGKDRLFWVEEENGLLSRVRPNSENSGPLYLNFRGAGRLPPRELQLLESLLQFRRMVAARKDRPLFKILGNATLLSVVQKQPRNLPDLKQVQPLSAKQIDMYGRDLVEIVNAALALPEDLLPCYPHQCTPLLKPAARRRLKALRQWRDAEALRLDLDPALLCSKGLMTVIARMNPRNSDDLLNVKEMRTWQRTVFGKEILAALRGSYK